MAAFVKVAKTDEIASGQARGVEVNGKGLALFNIDGNFYALDDTCSHKGGPLSEGVIAGEEVTALGIRPSSTSERATCSAHQRAMASAATTFG